MFNLGKPRGARRAGAGMRSKYGEPTMTLRIPASKRAVLENWLAALARLELLRAGGQAEEAARLERAIAEAEAAFIRAIGPDAAADIDHSEASCFDGNSRKKLLDAGFRIFRLHEREKEIRELTNNSGWRKFGDYPTQKAARAAMNDLLQSPTHILD
jgi:hypothetical protein